MNGIEGAYLLVASVRTQYTALFKTIFAPLVYDPEEMMLEGPALFGAELEDTIDARLRSINGVHVRQIGGMTKGFYVEQWGVFGRDSPEALAEGLDELRELAGINPFTKSFFEEAEAYHKKERFPTLRHKLVHFYKEVHRMKKADALDHGRQGPAAAMAFARQLFYVQEPLVLGADAERQVADYARAACRAFIGDSRLPEGFDVLKELDLASIWDDASTKENQTLYRSACLL